VPPATFSVARHYPISEGVMPIGSVFFCPPATNYKLQWTSSVKTNPKDAGQPLPPLSNIFGGTALPRQSLVPYLILVASSCRFQAGADLKPHDELNVQPV